jgi:endonuclease/exonuclease/phosphatase family metal-dependent hydrolase
MLNTHFALFSKARLKSIPLILQRIDDVVSQAASKEIPVILLGDFNFNPQSKEHKAMAQSFQDSFNINRISSQANNQITFHEYSGSLYPRFLKKLWHRIDYIWVNDQIDIEQSQIILDNPSIMSGVYPSDHWPYLIDCAF